MTTIIKKITIAFLALLVIVGVVAPFANVFAATFNNDSRDYATGSSANWSNSVSANEGEVVSFLVYYHNTASDTASNTRIRVQLPSGAFTNVSIQGDVWAHNGSAVAGTASVSLSSNQTLTFIPGSVAWYPNQSTVSQTLPNGQNGSEIVSSNGLIIGDIASGWDAQGYIVFRAQVSSNTVNPPQQNGSAPFVSTNTASAIQQDRATVQGTVNPNNANTNAWFEYGTTQSFGNTTGYQVIGLGNSSTNAVGYFYNLNQNTTYYYRIVAQNAYGTTYGNILSFTTQGSTTGTGSAPYATTHSAYSVAQNSATLQGAANPNGLATTAWFEYGTTQSFGNTTGYQTIGLANSASTISGYLSNLSSNTTYYYRIVAQNAYGTTYGNTLNVMTQQSYGGGNNGSVPTAYTNTVSASGVNSATFSGSVNPNGNYTNAWFEYGLSQSLGYTIGYQALGSSSYASAITANVYNLAPNTAYYYRAVAQNSYGTNYGTILTFTTSGSSINNASKAPYVTSRAVQSVFRNSALINGNVNPNGSLTTAWFEWGVTASLGSRTMIQPVGMANYSDSYSAVLSGLLPGTDYYYRAVAQNAYGTTYGTILTFTTSAQTIVPVVVNNKTTEPRVVVQQITGSSAVEQTVILTPSIDKSDPRAGDAVKYSIQYRNEGASAITGATVKILLPSEVEYDSATMKPSFVEDNELTFDLGTIKGHSQGVITIKATIDTAVDADSALMFSATLNYTDAKKQFQSTSAYLTVMVEVGSAGLASLFGVFGTLLNNWFVDLVLGLLIGFGIYHFFVRQKEEEALIK
ncbi:MAG: Peptidase M23 [Candidatus Wolfebacteria bacterium GW2011_GWB1_47_243]|nr:MAG: Peptidase M23 [Candidatus Wolfebacteria bacterium GW2011_GWB1_47_243]